MRDLVEWCGFFGAWALVAGPIYQAVLELEDEQIEFDRVREASRQIEPLPEVSAYWWLLPPVRLYLERRRSHRMNRLLIHQMDPTDVEALMSFLNKATGWMFVAVGGFLLALQETYDVVEHYDWSIGIFVILLVVMAGLCVGYALSRDMRTKRIIDRERTSRSA